MGLGFQAISNAFRADAARRTSLKHTIWLLASIGWYLLVPLYGHYDAPLSYWTPFGSYDTAKECTEAQAHLIEWGQRRPSDVGPARGAHLTAHEIQETYVRSQCIATDDPRLNNHAH